MFDQLNEVLKKYDFSFFCVLIAIFLVGITNLYSITHDQGALTKLVTQQSVWFLLAFGCGFIISLFHPSTIQRFAYWVYAGNVGLLVMVLILGAVGMGAQRWIGYGSIKIQPSEFMKISIVFALSKWFSNNSSFGEIGIKELIVPVILTLIPCALIIKQPDLGTGGVVFLIFVIIAYFRKLKWSSIAKLSLVGIISAVGMYTFVLKDYQKRRIHTFIDPYKDAKNSGYNAIQSNIAIGSGGFIGKGYMKSSQASLNFLPEKHTDFVFSIFAEEHGFVGVILLMSLYFLFFFRLINLSVNTPRIFDSIFTIGILAIFALHVFINIAMVSGLFPIVGLPLPMMTYGGSSLLVFGILTGLATSMSNARTIF